MFLGQKLEIKKIYIYIQKTKTLDSRRIHTQLSSVSVLEEASVAGAGLGGRAKLKGDGGLAKGLWLLFCMSWGPWEGFKQRCDTI